MPSSLKILKNQSCTDNVPVLFSSQPLLSFLPSQLYPITARFGSKLLQMQKNQFKICNFPADKELEAHIKHELILPSDVSNTSMPK